LTNIKETIKAHAAQGAKQVIAFRRHIHANPELSFEEKKTASYVSDTLNFLGLKATNVAETGVVALVEGKNPNKRVLALRADMDALPIQEQNDVPYKSTNPGVMHACGHDVHTASLLGAAHILNQVKDSFEGTVKLIFQPGEARIPGGASLMIEDGVLEHPKVDQIIAQHVMPMIDVGKVGFRQGMYMASSDEIYLTVNGVGGHGAMPDQLIDPVLIASHIIVALQQVISRNADPKTPSVLSFGKVVADGATNVIPEQVKLEGTFRTDQVVDLDLWMAAEDFAFYSQQVDACFYRLGVRNESKGITAPVHTPTFDIDEDALEVGSGLMAWLAVSNLRS
jgi:amidohydrolase